MNTKDTELGMQYLKKMFKKKTKKQKQAKQKSCNIWDLTVYKKNHSNHVDHKLYALTMDCTVCLKMKHRCKYIYNIYKYTNMYTMTSQLKELFCQKSGKQFSL